MTSLANQAGASPASIPWALRTFVAALCLTLPAVAGQAQTDESAPEAGAAADDPSAPTEPAQRVEPEMVDELQEPAAPPDDEVSLAGPIQGPRDLLQTYGMGSNFFASFVDDEPLAFDDQDKMYRLLYRVRRLPAADLQRWSKGATAWRQLLDKPGEYRGQLFRVEGVITQVDSIPLSPEMKERLEIDICYRCRVTCSDGTPAYVLAAWVPKEWPRDQPIHERTGFTGLFVKRARLDAEDVPADARQPLVFIAGRLAWYPPTMLGKLRMDVGLLEDLHDRRALAAEERECFYQMLAAVGRGNTQTLVAAAQRQFAERRTELEQQLPELATQKSKEYVRARSELAQAEKLQTDVIPLFLNPESRRGELVTIAGNARRALRVPIDEPDIVERFGIRQYYELAVFTDDSQGNPVVCCVRELPAGMPEGDQISESVRVTGFFLKSWLYRADPKSVPKPLVAADGERLVVQRWAPLVIGREAQWIPRPSGLGGTLFGWVAAGGIALISLLLMFVAWRGGRGHRSYRQIVAQGGEGPGRGAGAGPDFTHLK